MLYEDWLLRKNRQRSLGSLLSFLITLKAISNIEDIDFVKHVKWGGTYET